MADEPMNEARLLALQSYQAIRLTHHDTFLMLTRLKAVVARDRDLEAATDAIGVLKKSFDMIKDLKMEVDKATEQLEKVVCALYMRDTSNLGKPIRGEWVTGSPGGKSRVKLPSQRSPEYGKFLKAIGVDGPSAAAGLVRPHYPSIQEYLNTLEDEGKPMPAGITANTSETDFSVRCTFHRDVELDSLCDERMTDDNGVG